MLTPVAKKPTCEIFNDMPQSKENGNVTMNVASNPNFLSRVVFKRNVFLTGSDKTTRSKAILTAELLYSWALRLTQSIFAALVKTSHMLLIGVPALCQIARGASRERNQAHKERC